MKKKKLKLSLNKSVVAKLQNDSMKNVLGGEDHNTMDVYCANNTLYPACGWSGVWGNDHCPIDTTATETGCPQ